MWRKKNTQTSTTPSSLCLDTLLDSKRSQFRRSLHCPSSKSPTTYLMCRVVDDEKYMSTFFESDEREREGYNGCLAQASAPLLFVQSSFGRASASQCAVKDYFESLASLFLSATWSLILFCEFHYTQSSTTTTRVFSTKQGDYVPILLSLVFFFLSGAAHGGSSEENAVVEGDRSWRSWRLSSGMLCEILDSVTTH